MKKLIAISVIICMSLAMIYIMNQSPLWLWALTFGSIAIAFLLLFVWSCCKLSAIATEREDEILLFEWRKGLQRNDLVYSGGITYRLESVGYYCECRTHSDVKFILLSDLWPVD